MTPPLRVAVVGAGPSGLAAAHRLIERGRGPGAPASVTVFEGSDRPGGAIGTDERDGFLVERGADGFITDKPALLRLAERLGIERRLIRTESSSQGALVVKDGHLEPIPPGFSMMSPTRLRAFLASPLLSPAGKLRALGELLLPRGPEADDESLGSFVRRRFGRELLDRLAQPLVGGIYGANPELLSLRATMPRFLDEERQSRSVTLGLRRKARHNAPSAHGARYSLFASFDRGMQVLVDALTSALPEGALRLTTPVQALRPRDDGGVIVASAAGEEPFDRVILATPSRSSAPLIEPFDATLALRLGAIAHGSCATVNLAFDRRVHALAVYGLVIPAIERRPAIAMTFASRKWAERAPQGGDLIRVFLGDEQAEELDDDQLTALARAELAALVGVREPPRFVVLRRHIAAMPHYHVGHLDRVAAIERRAARHPWLLLAGNSLRGVGLPDAVKAGEAAADQALGPASG